jgi:hypothetical protein
MFDNYLNNYEYLNNFEYIDLCINAVQQNGLALKYVKIKNNIIYNEAIKNNSSAIQFIDNPNDELLILSLKDNIKNLKYINNIKKKYYYKILFFMNLI